MAASGQKGMRIATITANISVLLRAKQSAYIEDQ
jgi:hypothetical protein